MGRLPSMVFVTRHGPRLDFADSEWHLRSPAPYDPPLTYGGWKQSHALGERIATIIQDRNRTEVDEEEDDQDTANGLSTKDPPSSKFAADKQQGHESRWKKPRLIIHTSPYLRCLQTAIAISAGISEQQVEARKDVRRGRGGATSHPLHSGSPHIQPEQGMPLASIAEPTDGVFGGQSKTDEALTKTLIRMDAFLGEWLTPVYFKDITPPPDSKMMVAAGMVEMTGLRDYYVGNLFPGAVQNVEGSQGGLWVGASSLSKINQHIPVDSEAKASIPRISRSSSHNIAAGSPMPPRLQTKEQPDLAEVVRGRLYKQPIPSYALSATDPIPQDYITFARDRCVEFDSNWDSYREPMGWGHGGQLGENWAEMNTRLRNGLRSMLHWYQKSAPTSQEMLPEPSQPLDDEDNDRETILIIVTHSAGCNALMHALSNQPVLVDVRTASLSLALQKSTKEGVLSRPGFLVSNRERSVTDNAPFDEYKVKLVASTDHLRSDSRSQSRRSTNRSSAGSQYSGWRSIASMSAASAQGSGGGLADPDQRSKLDCSTSSMERSNLADGPSPIKPKPELWTKPSTSHPPGLWQPRKRAPSKLRQVSVITKTPEKENANPLDNSRNTNLRINPVCNKVEYQPGTSKVHGLWGQLPDRTLEGPKKNTKRRWTHTAHP